MEHKVRTMIAFLLLGIPILTMILLIGSQPDITAQVVSEVQSPSNTDSLLFWKIVIISVLVVVAFFLYEKATKFQSRLHEQLSKARDIVPLLIRFGLAVSFIVMVANGFFVNASMNVMFISYLTITISVLLLFGLFIHFAAFLGLLVFIYSIAQNGLGLFSDLSILGGLVYLLYLKIHKFSFDDMLAKNSVNVDNNAPLTVLRVFQGISLLLLSCISGYPKIVILFGIMIILGFMLRLAEFAVIVTFLVNVFYYNADLSIVMMLFTAVALFIAGHTRHSLDYFIFGKKTAPVATPVRVARTPVKKKTVKKKATKKKVAKKKTAKKKVTKRTRK